VLGAKHVAAAPQLVDPAVQLAPLCRELALAALEVRARGTAGRHRDSVVQPSPRGRDVLFLGLELLEQRLEPVFVQVVHAAGIGRARDKVEGRHQVGLKVGRPPAEKIHEANRERN
jgi:hypothetical protein